MKKKRCIFLCLLLLWAFAVSPVCAAGASPRLVDRADYLTDSEEAALLNNMKAQLKTVRAQTAASAYVKPGSMHITERRELFLYHQIHRTAREVKASGGSSTHTSSSGRTHGGSSGTF